MPKTPPYQKKASEDHMSKHGYVWFSARVTPEWKVKFQELLAVFKKQEKSQNDPK